MKARSSNLDNYFIIGQVNDWNDFQDETIQFDTWNLNPEDDEETYGADRTDDADRDAHDPNRYLG